MIKKASITINCTNDAFGTAEVYTRMEIANILRNLLKKLEENDSNLELKLPLRDHNGNTVGVYEEEKEY